MPYTDPDDPLEHVEVVINTPHGSWPTEGYLEVPTVQKIEMQLRHAAKMLNIPDDKGWEARIDDRKLDTSESYRHNGLSGRIAISYGPVGSFFTTTA